MSSRTMFDNQFGDQITVKEAEDEEHDLAKDIRDGRVIQLVDACSNFVNALLGAISLHLGRRLAKVFFKEHIMSRHLDISRLFEFKAPTRGCGRLSRR